MQLQGKRIIVTGGARGTGKSVVQAYVKEGASVVSMDILEEEGKSIVKELNEKAGDKVMFYRCNVADYEEVQSTFKEAVDDLGGLDVLVNVAGFDNVTPAEDISPDLLNSMLDVNLKGTIFTNQAAFKAMKDEGGAIINFASDAGRLPYIGGAHYLAAKVGVMSWTRTIAHE